MSVERTDIGTPLPALPAEIDRDRAAQANAAETPFVQGEGDTNAIDANDVNQDGYGSCAVMSSIASIAAHNPEPIRDMIRDNGDGTYTVTFQRYDEGVFGIEAFGGGWESVEITVAGPFEGAAANAGDVGGDGQAEMWPAIIEKAYGQFTGNGYATYDDGENPATVQEAILGRDATTATPNDYSAGDLNERLENGEAVVAWTAGSDGWTPEQQKIADAYGIAGGHAYRVEDVYVDENGETRIKLDNPWGPNDDVDMPYSEYQALYYQVNSTPTR